MFFLQLLLYSSVLTGKQTAKKHKIRLKFRNIHQCFQTWQKIAKGAIFEESAIVAPKICYWTIFREKIW